MYDISKKIDKLTLEVLKKVKNIADKLKIDFFIVGATVRDMILNYMYGIKVYRATNDIDFAVSVKSWEEYKLLMGEIEKEGFEKSERILHRYTYKGMIIDFIPFGGVSADGKTITWPDKDGKEMNVIGFDDAFLNTEDLLIQTDPKVIIKAASVVSLVVLKMFSWNDRPVDLRSKDAKDLYLIIVSFLRAGNEERVFDHQDIIDQTTDYDLSGAMLLGRDLKNSVSQKVYDKLIEILDDSKLEALAYDMSKYENLYRDSDDEKVEWCVELLKSLMQGLKTKVS
ncbi:MAG: nucleotidyl transferase AbiEii/AbiGii toxin family protein [Ignavibacteria bacterium]|nr:nucleotidyl transferase AbiEii/AbiGii toxin family protein [Ignavibacteria bacterium]